MDARVELIWANQTQLEAGQRMQSHLHACHQLYYILEGEAVFLIGGKTAAGAGGQLLPGAGYDPS